MKNEKVKNEKIQISILVNVQNYFLSRIREFEIFELMRKEKNCYLRSIGNSRDWQERKRHFSNSYKFKEKNL